MSEIYLSSITVGRGLGIAIRNSLLCPETDRNIRIEKQAKLCVYFTNFNKLCVAVSFMTSISVTTVVLTLGKVECFK